MKILLVCLGNICRSPLAEGILKEKLPSDFFVDSAGIISVHEGKSPDERAVKTASNHHIDISNQRSRPITDADFENFDKIYCMDMRVLNEVISKIKNEEHHNKVSLFLSATGEGLQNAEVPDPYWGEMDDFENVFQLLDTACHKIAAHLKSELNH
ncbi:low molecular weight protein-tyrosine-phosphatase [Chryseobacterium fistulae]|uniref:protein-tyrosine-phosphatase n=1 Tax=Chryseobacterium fistulae TaxID=2675058 RepID=A0A6N4XZA9_9FLAO|nr:low molecular weight protein-tyrosine-phosphatase [Chryseobacterium fistulae]CAA7393078.1 Low molecular weight protein-tyrosine-phosphatase YfkJ [Chryseobacterium fistulae]